MKQTHPFTIRTIALLLIVVLIIPSPAFAAVPETAEPLASYYLDAYTAYIIPIGEYDIQIWWNVYGAGSQVDIGTLRIRLYESTDNVNWTHVKTYHHTTYTQMIDHGTGQSMDYVFYDGDHECYYKAYVTIYAGDGTNGDSRYIWTRVVQGTP